MLKSIILLLLSVKFLIVSSFAGPLQDHCKDLGGHVSKMYTCPKSKLPLPITTCSYRNQYNEVQFFNGCSGPTGGYKKIFFPACIQHDLCYHHEPATNGYTRKKCDQDLYKDLRLACEKGAKNIRKCKKWASFMYRAVRIVGLPAYHCANQRSTY
jgi:hypothetical protein